MKRRSLCKVLHIAFVTLVDNGLQGNTGRLDVRDRNGPVVQSRTKSDVSFHRIEFPSTFGVELLVHAFDELVDLVNDFSKTDHHFLGVDFQLVDKSVDLVDEQDRVNTLFECLTKNGLRLGHRTFDCVDNDDCAVDCTHCTGNIPAEVDVAWSIDHVDKILVTADHVDHGYV